MREYKPKVNAQKEVYYKDRFYVSPRVPRYEVSNEIDLQVIRDLEGFVRESYIERDTCVVWIGKDNIVEALKIIKANGYETLSEMSAIDYLERDGGFEIFYQLLSFTHKRRLRVKTFLKENEEIESVSSIFSSANWSEREMYDMFGIMPLHHPYPKRILMPDDWVGHPLLKSYPLQGDESARWYEVDTIFGREYREVVGEEQRDSARVDRYDSTRFSRLGYEVKYGEVIDKDNEVKKPIMYQEEDGVLFVTKLTINNQKQLDKRK
ncbi:NADH-quinone oxidoreductase subunit C [Helicobacter sp. WB40]|uniref:NADH-quinone oxidoreductase subunit C n=1 Tax=Helicobacter sp. WB40 TaxID=3004130 RepID=UPI0022EBD5A6|nr:NADH-quinone oxidoreductase subunit C [Helicobacter sp. WB40]MDA3966707.1 NADH-quinone oxidoreductase subunit C [Helicobacter sp. WB40]